MTTFIPEWGAVSGRQLQLRRIFLELGDDAAVRTPLESASCPVDYFLEHEAAGWLAVLTSDDGYAAIGPNQLFEAESRCAFLRAMEDLAGTGASALPKLMVLWSCNEEETAQLARDPALADGVVLRSGAALAREGAAGLVEMMRPQTEKNTAALRRQYFPESEIASPSVGRRSFHRDNGATLTGIFLDREQEWASKLDLNVPPEQSALARDFSVRLINGVAGSGKTLVALQRALLLAQTRPGEQILLVIHNAPVVADLIERLHRSGRPIPANLRICTFASWAVGQWRLLFGSFPQMPKGPRQLAQLLHGVWQSAQGLRLTEQQLLDECNFLNDAMIADLSAYLAADRAGRGFALRENERCQVWELHQQLTAQLAARGLHLWSAIAPEICRTPAPRAFAYYDHILVDEAQFMAPASLQLIKLALRPNGSIFLCADPRQGFLKSRMSWKSVGLDVAGRTKKLRRSYRTTSALLRAATALLARTVDDNPEDELAPDFDGMEIGVPPVLITAGTGLDAVDRVAGEIAALAAQTGFPLASILVMYGDGVSKDMLYAALCARIGTDKVWWLNKNRDKPPDGYGAQHVRMANIDSATGLEGTFVFLLGVDALLAKVTAVVEQHPASDSDARKIYMAMTRSCYRLTVVTARALPDEAVHGIFERRD